MKLSKILIQDALEAELDNHLRYKKYQESESQIQVRDIHPK